jgi:hypothetical protein
MSDYVMCPYYRNGDCALGDRGQSKSQIDYYCLTPKDKENWHNCANYYKASAEDKLKCR